MDFKLTGRHFHITPNLRRHVETKVKKLEKFNHQIIDAEIVLFQDRAADVAEGRLHYGHFVIAAKGEGKDMYLAVNELVDRLLVQLTRHEGKLRDRRRSAASG